MPVLGMFNTGEIFHVLTLMGFIQGLLLTALLWRRRKADPSVIFLVFHLLILTAIMALPLAEEATGSKGAWPFHALVFFLFHGLYFYVRHFQTPFKTADWLLQVVLPGGLFAGISYWVYCRLGTSGEADPEQSLGVTLLSCGKILVNLAYASATLAVLVKHRKLILGMYSDTSEVRLQWVSRLVYGFFSIILGAALLYVVARAGFWPMQMTDLFTYLGFVLYLYYAYWHATQQRPMTLLEPAPSPRLNEGGKDKYQRSSLTREQGIAIFQRIKAAMEQGKLYRNADLTLPALAEAAEAPGYHISQVLGEVAGQNFYDFVNTYRVNEAKRLLTDPSKQHYTILAIAFEAGFNSKTTFNKVFKNVTGQTPSEYLSERRKTTDASPL